MSDGKCDVKCPMRNRYNIAPFGKKTTIIVLFRYSSIYTSSDHCKKPKNKPKSPAFQPEKEGESPNSP
ncbi:hypothetical protein [Methanocalculus sp.]|uniref:hypothetical protein n=1 Tax=Methanocalculus sp. TaxID=2004547 RepID=UPI002638DF59|nr:hypothetical protein [Methanocalculus sp.]MDG6249873.1 hypothetical protein [Methanocalculus sp.]